VPEAYQLTHDAVEDARKRGDTRAKMYYRAAVRRSLYVAVKTITCFAFCTKSNPNLFTYDTHFGPCEWVQWVITTKKRGLFEDPRKHAKSTITTLTVPWWLSIQVPDAERDSPAEFDRAARFIDDHPHLKGADSRLAIGSESKKIATRWNAAGREQWLRNTSLRWLFDERVWTNPNKPDYGTFSREEYVLPGRLDPTKPDPYCCAIGIDSREVGGAKDGIMFDDLVSEKSYGSPTELQRRTDWFRLQSQTLENQDYDDPYGGFLLLTENRWALDDPNTHVHKELHDWAIWRRSAYRCYVHDFGNCGRWSGDDDSDCAERDEGIWPERHPNLENIRRDKGDIIFDIQWRNNPVAHPIMDASKFIPFRLEVRAVNTDRGVNREWVAVIDEQKDSDTGEVFMAPETIPLTHLYCHRMSIDPAAADDDSEARKKGKTARHCISWFALDKARGLVLNLDVAAGHWGPEEAIKRYYEAWMDACEKLGRRVEILCEKVAAQIFVAKALKFYAQERGVTLAPVEMVPRKRGEAKFHHIRNRVGNRLGQRKLLLREGLSLPRSEVRHAPNGTLDWLDTEAQYEEIALEHHGASGTDRVQRLVRKRLRRRRIARSNSTGAPLI